MGIEAALLSAATAIGGGLIGAFVTHWLSSRREIDKKVADVRVEYLIDCWMKIERAANIDPTIPPDVRNARLDGLEEAVSKIMLLGDKREVEAAKRFARELAGGSNASIVELLNSLRDNLRVKLQLDSTPALDTFFRMRRAKQ